MPTENEIEFDKIIKRSAKNINELLQDLHYADTSDVNAYFYTNNIYLLTRIEMGLDKDDKSDDLRVIDEKTLKEDHKYLVELLDDIDLILKTKQNNIKINATIPQERLDLKKVYQGLEAENPREDLDQKLRDMENLQVTTNKLFSDIFERVKKILSDLIKKVKDFVGVKDSKEEIHQVKQMNEEIQGLKKQDVSTNNKEQISTAPEEKIDKEITRKRKGMFSSVLGPMKDSNSDAPSQSNDNSSKLKKG